MASDDEIEKKIKDGTITKEEMEAHIKGTPFELVDVDRVVKMVKQVVEARSDKVDQRGGELTWLANQLADYTMTEIAFTMLIITCGAIGLAEHHMGTETDVMLKIFDRIRKDKAQAVAEKIIGDIMKKIKEGDEE
jgi:hypothetical protein